MKNGWTGGQYSLYRALAGAYLFVCFILLIPRVHDLALPLTIAAAAAALFFLAGLLDRVAAVLMACVLAFLLNRDLLLPTVALPLVGLLLAHLLLPPAPFFSVAARKRIDPRGGWSMRPAVFAAAWIATSLGYAYLGWTKLAAGSPSLELVYAPLALFRPVRPWLWTAMLLVHVVRLDFAMAIAHLLTFDPAWIRQKLPQTTDTVFYDGTCGLCHRGMRFLVAEDPTGTSFRYAPLGGDAFAAQFPDPGDLPDSVIVQTPAGETIVRSDAAVYLLQRLGGLWRVLGTLFAVLPKRLRDAIYDFVARVRYRIFGREKDACPIVPPDLRSRFNA